MARIMINISSLNPTNLADMFVYRTYAEEIPSEMFIHLHDITAQGYIKYLQKQALQEGDTLLDYELVLDRWDKESHQWYAPDSLKYIRTLHETDEDEEEEE